MLTKKKLLKNYSKKNKKYSKKMKGGGDRKKNY